MKSEKKWMNKSEKVLEIIFKCMNSWVKGSKYQLKVGIICGDCVGGIRICAWNTEKKSLEWKGKRRRGNKRQKVYIDREENKESWWDRKVTKMERELKEGNRSIVMK